MSDSVVKILYNAAGRGAASDSVVQQVVALSPRIALIKPEEVRENPALLAEVEIVYGYLPADQWAAAPKLRWVQITGAGVDRLLTEEVQAHPAVLTNVHIHGVPIAEHLFGMLLMFTRGLNVALRQQTEGRWDAGPVARATDTLPGKTLGIVGLGAIGLRTAELGEAFGMRVLGLRRRPCPVAHVERVCGIEDKLDFLGQCDYVMLTIPATPDSYHFIGKAELTAMKPTALLFNIGRGKTVDTDALVEALRDGVIAGAGLDVVDPEPLPEGHPLWSMPNVIITPHMSGGFPTYREHTGAIFLENLRRYLDGEPLLNVVDKRLGY